MNVADRMTQNPFTINPDESVGDGRDRMKREKVHRLPVVDKKGRIQGIVTEKDILYASPSPAGTLDIWEITTLLSQLKIREVMTPNPVCCSPNTPVEEAVRLIRDNNISGLPVVSDDILTGIITESDLLEVFIELFAIREKGLRMTVLLPNVQGELATFSSAIRDAGGDILSFGSVRGENPGNRLAITRISNLSEEELRNAVKPYVQEIREIRTMKPG